MAKRSSRVSVRNCRYCGKQMQGSGQSFAGRKYCNEECRKAFRSAPCEFSGCNKTLKYDGLCSGHAEQRRLGKDLTPLSRQFSRKWGARCSFETCLKLAQGKGLCWGHAEQSSRGYPLTDLRERLPTNTHALRDDLGRKHCGGCDRWLDESCFAKSSKRKADGLHYRCRDCAHSMRVERQFGVPVGWYQEQLAKQDGACAVCRTPQAAIGKRLHVDHDHSCCPSRAKCCGRCVRALLCDTCNTALGSFRDNPELLMNAVRYLEAHRERRVA